MSSVKDYPAGTGIGDRLAEVQSIKLQIDALEAKLDEHKAYLLGHAIRNNLDALRHGALILSRRARATWVYSQAIKSAEAKLKQRKLNEQESGVAVARETEHLVVSFSTKAALANQLIEA